MDDWIRAGTRSELDQKGWLLVWIAEDWPVVVFGIGNEVYVVDARCTHQDAWLQQGTLDTTAHQISCPLHDARFDLATGQAIRGPAAAPLTTYPSQIAGDGTIWLQPVLPWWQAP